MDYAHVATLVLAGLCALLLVVVLLQLGALRASFAALAEKSAKSRDADGADPAVLAELKRIEDQIGRFDIVFSDIQRQLAGLTTVKPAAPAAAAVDRPSHPDRSSTAPPAQPYSVEETPPPPPRAGDAPLAATAPVQEAIGSDPAASRSPPDLAVLKQLTLQYRDLIAQPIKNEINRWSEEAGGWACEVGEDGAIQALGRDAGGLLVLLSQDDRVGIIVPGGRMVVDFATSFSDVISMRRVTRQSFELVNDGTGVMRLIEPALATREGDRWQLARPGKLAGLKTD